MSTNPSKQSGSGNLDYGANHPTGGTNENTGNINPQGPTSGTENYSPDKKKGQQTTASGDDSPLDDGHNAQDWTSRNVAMPISGAGDFGTSPISPNAGDIQDERGDLNQGATATRGYGAGDPGGHHSFRCADAGNSDCRWETNSASSNELWADIECHHREVHGKPSLDETSRGRLQDAIHVRRAA